MKQLLILVGAVAILLVVWWVTGKGALPSHPALEAPSESKAHNPVEWLRAAHQLWEVVPGRYAPEDVALFLRRLDASLDDARYAAVAAPVLHAWEEISKDASAAPLLGGLAELLVPRILRVGSYSDAERVIGLASLGRPDSVLVGRQIDLVLSEVAKDSRRTAVVGVALLRQGDRERLGKLLEQAGEAPVAAALRRAAELTAVPPREIKDVAAAIREWSSAGEEETLRHGLRLFLERRALEALQPKGGEAPPVAPVAELLKGTAQEPQAGEFWSRVVRRTMEWLWTGHYAAMRIHEELLRGVEETFGHKGLAMKLWELAAERVAFVKLEDPSWPILFREKALAAAGDENSILRLAPEVALGLAAAGQFEQARAALQGALERASSEAARKRLEDLRIEVARHEAEAKLKAEEAHRQAEIERVRARLRYMKAELDRARKEGRPVEDVRSLEQVVRTLEREVAE